MIDSRTFFRRILSQLFFVALFLVMQCCFFFDFAAADAPPGIDASAIRKHHQALVDIASRAGGLHSGVRLNAAGVDAAEYILRGYNNAGLERIRAEEFFPNRWWPEEYDLTAMAGGAEKKLNVFPLWNCEGADNLDLELVHVGFGTKGEFRGLDVKGKAVLVDMKRILHFISSYRYTKALDIALEKGAKAVIVAETRIDSPNGNSVGSAGKIEQQRGGKPDLFPIPVFSIGKRDGDFLRNRIKDEAVRVRLNLQYSLAPARATNIVGELPGSGEIDEVVIVGGHYDTWFDGAVDNLGSQAALLEIARYFAAIPREKRKRDLLFVSIFGHEFENEQMGHAAFVERHAELQGKVACFLDIDGSGSWGWEEKGDSGEIHPTGSDDKAGIFATSYELSAIARKSVYPYAKGPWGQYPLNSFVADLGGPISEAGYPCLLLISKHIYYHSTLDTIDRISPDQVYRRTRMNIDVIQQLLDSPAGRLISVDQNPHRKMKKGEMRARDLTRADMPTNPTPWIDGPPTDLDMHIIPANPRLFSPVIAWVGHWRSDAALLDDAITWNFGGFLGLFKSPKKVASGTMYFFPGKKTIKMTITDSQGRSSTISREVEVGF